MRAVRTLVLAGLAGLLGSGALVAQESVRPVFRAESRGDSVLLQIEVPSGWSLYAPSVSDANGSGSALAPPVGRPLRVLSGGIRATIRSWPEAVVRPTALGTARVHEAGRYQGVLGVGPAAPRELEIEWALCSDTLCIPGRSRVAF